MKSKQRTLITISEAKAKRSLAVLMGRAHHGQEFIVTRGGEPWARLIANHAT
jgi:antitoxin (DNA-binding transcriptional repressor) of toxin-antitoxin stability system